MPHTIKVRMTITVDGGPQVAASRVLEVDAYDTLDVVIPNDGNAHSVEVQPDDGDQLRLVLLSASSYDPLVTWEADGSGTTHALDEPLLLAGESVAGLLRTPDNEIAFTNGGGDEVRLQILVGRDAVG